MRSFSIAWLDVALVVALAASILRFVALETSPPGFYVDEAAIAAQVQCVRDGGHDHMGKSWPVFSRVLGGGYATPPTLYLGSVWTKVFGDSIGSFRALSAFFGVIFVFAIGMTASFFWRSREAGVLAAVAAAISPWSFQFSRIAWDPAFAPAFLALSLAMLFASCQRAVLCGFLSGIFAALAAYSYPPLRVQLTLVVPVAFVLLFSIERSDCRKKIAPFLLSSVVLCAPLFVLTVRGDIQSRYRMLSVFNPKYLRSFGETSVLSGLKHFAMNLWLHFGFGFLFLRGDENPRHATGAWGEWSPLDIVAVAILLFFVVRALRNRKLGRGAGAVAFVVFGYVAGLVPASLTWESNPHALRSIGATVFLALGTGGALAWLWRKSRVSQPILVTLAVGFSIFYFHDYFAKYPQRVGLYFDEPAIEKIVSFEKEKIPLTDEAAHATPELQDYPLLALRYFQVREGLYRCR